MEVDSKKPQQQTKKNKLGDFSKLGSMLDQIESKASKKSEHEQRLQQHSLTSKAAQNKAYDEEKERLNKIASLQAF